MGKLLKVHLTRMNLAMIPEITIHRMQVIQSAEKGENLRQKVSKRFQSSLINHLSVLKLLKIEKE